MMAKEPVLGRVKTRLARAIGAAQAVRFYRAASSAVLRRISGDPRFETIIGLTPAPAFGSRAGSIPHHLRRIDQGRGDLGTRMLQLAQCAPPGPVLVVGSDIPAITSRVLVAASKSLGRNDVVFGPADDGGFWLVGFSRRRPVPQSIFEHVRWSHADTLADVLGNCGGLRVGFVDKLSDVDSAGDLKRLAHRTGRLILPA